MKHLCRIFSFIAVLVYAVLFAACGSDKEAAPSSAWTTVARTTAGSTVASTAATAMKTTAPPTTSPTTPTNPDEPEESGYTQGQTGYSTFESAYIGLGIKLSADWKFLSRADINTLDGNPSDFLTNGSTRGIGMIKTFTEVWATNTDGDAVKIVLREQDEETKAMTLEALVSATAAKLERDDAHEYDRIGTTLTAVSCAGDLYPGIEVETIKAGVTEHAIWFMKDLGDYIAAVQIVKQNTASFDRELAMFYAVS